MTRKQFLKRPTQNYSDWFGGGNSTDDFNSAEKGQGKKCTHVYICEDMLLLEFDDCFVANGYDGNEYMQSFKFPKP